MTDHEISARRPVWIALSDLFLDTDVRMSFAYIARVLAESPYSLDELRNMLIEEVTPVLQSNLLQVAGEWAGFNEEWLVGQIVARAGKRRWIPMVVNVDHHWEVVRHLVSLLRTAPDTDSRRRRLRGIEVLLPLFLKKDPAAPDLEDISNAELESFYREDLWPVLIVEARKLAKLEPRTYPSEEEIERNWRMLVDRCP